MKQLMRPITLFSACVAYLLCQACTICPISNCPIDLTGIVVDESAVPSVPDQIVGGCYSLDIERTFANDAEFALILRAESLASTVGPDWFSTTKMPGVGGSDYPDVPPFPILDAVNSALQEVKDDGTLTDLYQQWFKTDPPESLLQSGPAAVLEGDSTTSGG